MLHLLRTEGLYARPVVEPCGLVRSLESRLAVDKGDGA